MLHIPLNGFHQVGDEVKAPFKLDVNLRPGVLNLVTPPDQTVIGQDEGKYQQHHHNPDNYPEPQHSTPPKFALALFSKLANAANKGGIF